MATSFKPDFYITVGASAGGLNAVTELVSSLPTNLKAAVFVVLHLSKIGVGDFLIHRLQKYTNYTCVIGAEGMEIEGNTIYLAPPDKHLLIKDDHIVLGLGPAENRWRPSVDVLFRSAAVAKTNKVIGIVLTGYLNDGTSGMDAIKRSGGVCIVQDPHEAEYPDMPLSVIEHMEVDHCISLKEMGSTIEQIIEHSRSVQIEAPEDVKVESMIAERVVTSVSTVEQIGETTNFVCPDCGGGLWRMPHDAVERFRCHIGHSYTMNDFILKQGEKLEATLWVALRMMEERKNVLEKVKEREDKKGLKRVASTYNDRIDELEKHVDILKHVLFNTQKRIAV
jgi:two-component system chemotaxis response regulator CheB